jgi:hypothetical protein
MGATHGELPAGAHAIYMAILSKPDGAQIRDGFVANCRDGQQYARDRHITTAAELARAAAESRVRRSVPARLSVQARR